MIAYVIKNKKGKFWQFLHNNKSEFVDEIYNAFFHYSKHDAEKTICSWGLKDCKVVEITIVEGDLEQELTEKDKEIEKLNLMIKTLPNHDAELEQTIRKQVCDEFKKAIFEESYIKTEEEAKYIVDDIDVGTILEIIDKIEKGEE